jgi:hypothetical protein
VGTHLTGIALMSEVKTRTHGLSSSAGWALEALEPMIVQRQGRSLETSVINL